MCLSEHQAPVFDAQLIQQAFRVDEIKIIPFRGTLYPGMHIIRARFVARIIENVCLENPFAQQILAAAQVVRKHMEAAPIGVMEIKKRSECFKLARRADILRLKKADVEFAMIQPRAEKNISTLLQCKRIFTEVLPCIERFSTDPFLSVGPLG